MQTEGWKTYMPKLVVAFRNYANAPKNGISSRLTNLWLNVVVHISRVMHKYELKKVKTVTSHASAVREES
jgi:hypothetical protein